MSDSSTRLGIRHIHVGDEDPSACVKPASDAGMTLRSHGNHWITAAPPFRGSDRFR
jgi:hypothetical protein